jgi:toxin secretion/phage lysis holin
MELFQKVWTCLFGLSDGLLRLLIVAVLIDYITGICVAIYERKLSSKIGFYGITKKIAIFCLISLSHTIDEVLLHDEDALRTVTTIFYASNECISIFENVGRLDLPLPDKLKSILTHLEEYKNAK